MFFDIAKARINEILELVLLKNINLKYHTKSPKFLFFQLKSASSFQSIKDIYKKILLQKGFSNVKHLDEFSHEDIVHTARKLAHFGWKNEAILLLRQKKLITRFFSLIFE